MEGNDHTNELGELSINSSLTTFRKIEEEGLFPLLF